LLTPAFTTLPASSTALALLLAMIQHPTLRLLLHALLRTLVDCSFDRIIFCVN
jgi:hypothetical protein